MAYARTKISKTEKGQKSNGKSQNERGFVALEVEEQGSFHDLNAKAYIHNSAAQTETTYSTKGQHSSQLGAKHPHFFGCLNFAISLMLCETNQAKATSLCPLSFIAQR